MPGTLYVVATPIGNLADITLRALSTLREVDIIAAEDTRVTRKLLRHYEIDTPMTPYHQHSLGHKPEQLLKMLNEGKSIAMVSDAGTPGISDPGHEIITLCIHAGVPVVSIPGASAIISALVVSGISTRRFTFEGFPPRRHSERISCFKSLETEQRTMVFYESPMRLLPTLTDMQAVWGDRPVAVAREITKMFEEIHRGTLGSAIERFTTVKARGEICIVVSGTVEKVEITTDEIRDALQAALDSGKSERDAVHDVAEKYPVPKKEVYRKMLEMKGAADGK
jgi:16S rRNA (cytidine1402-2'-O)-methyltransferase